MIASKIFSNYLKETKDLVSKKNLTESFLKKEEDKVISNLVDLYSNKNIENFYILNSMIGNKLSLAFIKCLLDIRHFNNKELLDKDLIIFLNKNFFELNLKQNFNNSFLNLKNKDMLFFLDNENLIKLESFSSFLDSYFYIGKNKILYIKNSKLYLDSKKISPDDIGEISLILEFFLSKNSPFLSIKLKNHPEAKKILFDDSEYSLVLKNKISKKSNSNIPFDKIFYILCFLFKSN